MSKHLQTILEKQDFLNNIDNLLLDCDGVLWHGKQVISKIPETIEYLRSLNKNLYFITNNSTQSRAQYIKKFEKMGIKIKEEEIFSSAYLSALYIKNNFDLKDKKVFVIGMDGIKHELELLNIKHMSLDETEASLDDTLLKYQPDETIGLVLVGMDVHINYSKYAFAHQCIIRGLPFLATNDDKTYPLKDTTYPGTGAILNPLIASTNKQPVVLGKPNLIGFEVIQKQFNLDINRTCMIGDRLDTDIKFGLDAKIKTLLVLSGVTKSKELKESEIQPQFILNELTELLQ